MSLKYLLLRAEAQNGSSLRIVIPLVVTSLTKHVERALTQVIKGSRTSGNRTKRTLHRVVQTCIVISLFLAVVTRTVCAHVDFDDAVPLFPLSGLVILGRDHKPLVPRRGKTLVVGIVARISGCADQKEVSLEDQIDHAKEVVAELHDGPIEWRIIATKGKGVLAVQQGYPL